MENFYSIPYGKRNVTFSLPKDMKVTVIRPRPTSPSHHEQSEIERALDEPIGTSRLEELKPGKKISIVISDLTRPVPHHLLLPALLKKLDALNIPRNCITIMIATGQHSRVPPNQFHRLVDPVWVQGMEVICHDPLDHLVYIGETSRGTPVWVNRTFSESDFKILTGMIDPHQFVGFTGGSKMVSIGLAGLQTIETNHSMFTHPNAQLGKVRGNPVREDIDEMGRMLGIHFILNIVLNEENQVVKAFSGHYLKAWREGVKLTRSLYGRKVGEKMDLVIASPGGYPKDIDLYQVQKALAHAAKIVKPGGTIILVGQCVEGVGDDLFFEMVKQSKTPEDVVSKFQSQRFKMGPHKAFLLCRSLIHHQVYFYSDKMPPALIEKFFLTPISSVQEGISKALSSLASHPRIAILPKASSTFFIE